MVEAEYTISYADHKAAARLYLRHFPRWAKGEMNRNAARFQLILQFSATSPQEFDAVVALEEELMRSLPPIAEVDGHDFGVCEFNIFVLTDRPTEAFDVAKVLIQQRQPQQQLRAAYRDMAKEEFVILWPPGLREFTVA